MGVVCGIQPHDSGFVLFPVKAKICRMSSRPDVYVMINNEELIVDAQSICLTFFGSF